MSGQLGEGSAASKPRKKYLADPRLELAGCSSNGWKGSAARTLSTQVQQNMTNELWEGWQR